MQKQILVMEDNDVLRQLYSRALRTTGQGVHQAATVQEARELLARQVFDVFLADMDMGSERGSETTRSSATPRRRSSTRAPAPMPVCWRYRGQSAECRRAVPESASRASAILPNRRGTVCADSNGTHTSA